MCFVPGGLHGDRNFSGALDVWYISLALWMSGQTPPNGRRSHIIAKKVRLASIGHVCQPTLSKKCRDNGRIYGPFGRVGQDKPRIYERTRREQILRNFNGQLLGDEQRGLRFRSKWMR